MRWLPRTVLIILCIILTAGSAAHADTVTVAGSGGMIPLMNILAATYMKKYPHDSIQVNQESLTQSGGILAARSGAVDIGMSARLLTSQELDGEISAYHIANVPAVVAVHRNVRISNITVQQLCAVYSGTIRNWRELGGHDAPIVVLTRPESDSTKMAFRNGLACFRDLTETVAAIKMFKSADMLNALQRMPDSIGLIDLIALDSAQGKAHPLKLEGRVPTAGDIMTGQWPIVKKYTLVVGKERKKGVDRFLRFIRSRDGAALILGHKGIPLPFTYP